MEFNKVQVYGVAGGISRTGTVTAHIEASQCDTVASVEWLLKAAPKLLVVLKEAEAALLELWEQLPDDATDEQEDQFVALATIRGAIAEAERGQ